MAAPRRPLLAPASSAHLNHLVFAAMANYTKVNLKDVEDQAPSGGLSPGLKAHFARAPLELEKSGISYFRIAPNFRIPFGHKHSEQEEVYLVVDGSARARVDDDVVELEAMGRDSHSHWCDAWPRSRAGGRRGDRVRRAEYRERRRRDDAGLVDRLKRRWSGSPESVGCSSGPAIPRR